MASSSSTLPTRMLESIMRSSDHGDQLHSLRNGSMESKRVIDPFLIYLHHALFSEGALKKNSSLMCLSNHHFEIIDKEGDFETIIIRMIDLIKTLQKKARIYMMRQPNLEVDSIKRFSHKISIRRYDQYKQVCLKFKLIKEDAFIENGKVLPISKQNSIMEEAIKKSPHPKDIFSFTIENDLAIALETLLSVRFLDADFGEQLNYSVRYGHRGCVQIFLATNRISCEGLGKATNEAAEKGDQSSLQALIATKEISESWLGLASIRAAANGRLVCLQMLLQTKMISTKDLGWVAWSALQKGHLDCFQAIPLDRVSNGYLIRIAKLAAKKGNDDFLKAISFDKMSDEELGEIVEAALNNDQEACLQVLLATKRFAYV